MWYDQYEFTADVEDSRADNGDSGGEPIMLPYNEVIVEVGDPLHLRNDASDEDSPPVTGEDRRPWPALPDEQQHGGQGESKRFEGECVPSQFLPGVVDKACENFAKFWHWPREDVSESTVVYWSPALGIAGWSDPELRILDYGQIQAEKDERERREKQPHIQPGAAWSFGDKGSGQQVDQQAEEYNRQVTKLIEILGDPGAGRKAIIKAMAARQGITDECEVDDLLKGRSTKKLRAPLGLREALCGIGMSDVLAPINLITTAEENAILLSDDAEWQDLEFEVALDSGSVVHVCSLTDCPGYGLEESPGSKRKQHFLMGDGGEIPNLGQKQLNLTDASGARDLQSVFQIAAVTRPLMSVGRICDEGHRVTFDNIMAVVHDKDGDEICRFHRNGSGLYVAKLKLRSPAGFGRPE